ncbi:MAG: hypothetical protein HWD60_09270 [Defluviicoccus sp.]|nr:MAG: hypothetical protein HWD60_09270 [Defluviicoccus sp.]
MHPLADILRAHLFAIACGRPEAMEWCAANGVDYLFGLPGNTVLDRLVDEAACPDASPIRHLATALAGP